MGTIIKNHFALAAENYQKGLESGRYNTSWPNNLAMIQIPATLANYSPLVKRLGEKWGWDKQDRYNGAALAQKLENPSAALYLLKDAGEVVGYSFASAPADTIKARFFGAARVVEIENLGLFPGNEGGGRGKAYFEMLFTRYFKDHDVVYWSQHETHAPTLSRFYKEKMGMTLLARDAVPDFRAGPPIPKIGMG